MRKDQRRLGNWFGTNWKCSRSPAARGADGQVGAGRAHRQRHMEAFKVPILTARRQVPASAQGQGLGKGQEKLRLGTQAWQRKTTTPSQSPRSQSRVPGGSERLSEPRANKGPGVSGSKQPFRTRPTGIPVSWGCCHLAAWPSWPLRSHPSPSLCSQAQPLTRRVGMNSIQG